MHVRDGNYIETAAKAVGISKQTLYNWRNRAAEFDDATVEELEGLDEDRALLVWFVDALNESEANAEIDLLAEVRAANSHWTAQMTILERRFPARWRRRDEIEHSGSVDVNTPLTPEQEAEELVAFAMPAAFAVATGPEAVEPPPDA